MINLEYKLFDDLYLIRLRFRNLVFGSNSILDGYSSRSNYILSYFGYALPKAIWTTEKWVSWFKRMKIPFDRDSIRNAVESLADQFNQKINDFVIVSGLENNPNLYQLYRAILCFKPNYPLSIDKELGLKKPNVPKHSLLGYWLSRPWSRKSESESTNFIPICNIDESRIIKKF